MGSATRPPAAIVFDLFHTLVDTEHLRPVGFDAVREVAMIIDADPIGFAEFWDATYVERETSLVDLVDLTVRFCGDAGLPVTVTQRNQIDVVFGVGKDEALRQPRPEIVALVGSLTTRCPLGVLSNCDAREVRAWSSSPLARHVAVFAQSCEIGFMKPDARSYEWVIGRLGVDPPEAIFVGNGSSDELDGARSAGFGMIVHCNVFDAVNGLVPIDEQHRRAAQADVSVTTFDQLREVLLGATRTPSR